MECLMRHTRVPPALATGGTACAQKNGHFTDY